MREKNLWIKNEIDKCITLHVQECAMVALAHVGQLTLLHLHTIFHYKIGSLSNSDLDYSKNYYEAIKRSRNDFTTI